MFVRLGAKYPMKHVPGFITRYRWWSREIDSRQARSVERFVKAKRLVMDQLFNNPATPKKIRGLRRRAYAGLNMWAASMQSDSASSRKLLISSGLRYIFAGFLMHPSKTGFMKSLNILINIIRSLGKYPAWMVNTLLKIYLFVKYVITFPFVYTSSHQKISNRIYAASGFILFTGGSLGIIIAFFIFHDGHNDWKQWVLSSWLLSISGLTLLLISIIRNKH
jgi:hypothetical protein